MQSIGDQKLNKVVNLKKAFYSIGYSVITYGTHHSKNDIKIYSFNDKHCKTICATNFTIMNKIDEELLFENMLEVFVRFAVRKGIKLDPTKNIEEIIDDLADSYDAPAT